MLADCSDYDIWNDRGLFDFKERAMVSKAQVIFTFTINNSKETQQVSFREAANWYFRKYERDIAVVRRKCDDEVAIFSKKNIRKQKKLI